MINMATLRMALFVASIAGVVVLANWPDVHAAFCGGTNGVR